VIRLDRIEDAAGVRWQLYLPPTQTWSVDGGVLPADGTSNLAAMGGVECDAVEAAVEVMRAAGIGAGDPVMAVGYSQGGIVAAALAADPAVQDEFAVRQVLTVGAPVSRFDIPPDVQVLSIEHGADFVPQLDGDRNPDRPHWATVERDVQDRQHGHDLAVYLDTARAVDASDHASVRTWLDALVDFGGGGDAEVTTQNWQTVRIRD
jgi:pimeloyl-ACP methyl ester carboxylesterase